MGFMEGALWYTFLEIRRYREVSLCSYFFIQPLTYQKSSATAGRFSALKDELISPIHTLYISPMAPALLLLCGCFALSPPCRAGKGVTDLKYTDKQIEHIQYAFRTFCKKVLCHEAINAYRYLQRRERRETSLDALCSLEPAAAFMEQEIADSFTVRGEVFFVANEQLAAALLALPEQQREILFLYFYFGYSDKEIGTLIGRSRSATNRRRDIALKQLRKEMEVLKDNG